MEGPLGLKRVHYLQIYLAVSDFSFPSIARYFVRFWERTVLTGMARKEFVFYVHRMLHRVNAGKLGVCKKPATG
jgi:hypothetical protein